jgi:hypothetical protein
VRHLGRQLSLRYALDGGIRRDGNGMPINPWLDAVADGHRCADVFVMERELVRPLQGQADSAVPARGALATRPSLMRHNAAAWPCQ